MDLRQAFVATEVRVGELILVEAELIQDGSVNIAEVIRFLDRSQADGIGGSDDSAALDSATGHPHGEAQIVVVSANARLCFRRTSELATPQDQR